MIKMKHLKVHTMMMMHHVKLSGNVYSELKWWTENITDSFHSLSGQLPEIEVHSQSCPNGWGRGGGGGAVSGDSSTGDLWKAKEALLHINILETAVAYFAVKVYCNNLENSSMHLKIDNTATVASLNKQKGAHITVFNIIKKI